jgi:hypothetical protein
LVSLVYLLTRRAIFTGFNGTDDMHYAMLAANMLKGRYNPFAAADIFSGRVLLIALQALFYRVGGINVFTTQAPAMLAVLLCCWLTVFVLIKAHSVKATVVAASLFYFNPVLTNATDGILPDVYVMLAGILTVYLFNKSLLTNHAGRQVRYGVYMAVAVAAGFFFKETVIVFPVLAAGLTLVHRNKQAVTTFTAMLVALFAIGAVCAGVYYHYTGNVFYRWQQIENSRYFNPCSYDVLPVSFLITRLTFGVWKLFMATGFYPVLFATGIVCCALFKKNTPGYNKNAAVLFATLLMIALYLPFSLTGYQPLCSDSSRHFLFLLPFGVWVTSPALLTSVERHKNITWIILSMAGLLLCIYSTPDKWQWMMWALFAAGFIVLHVYKGPAGKTYSIFILAAIPWCCMPYRLFYNNSHWFANMQQLNNKIKSNCYYFADHDNMTHWQLLHQFNDTIHCYNLAPQSLNLFKQYYQPLNAKAFTPGWFVVNKTYTERSAGFLHTVDSLKQQHYFTRTLAQGNVIACYISQPAQLDEVKTLTATDEKIIR